VLRLSKLCDYAIVVLVHFARDGVSVRSAADVARSSRIPRPTVAKILKSLTSAGLLASARGASGGYRLSRPPEAISVSDIIAAMEEPLALTDCASAGPCDCRLERTCLVREHWRTINETVRQALGTLSLADLARPVPKTSRTGSIVLLARSPR
jgi:FeS assembly SUF system regulator